jgi:hypothetical protein
MKKTPTKRGLALNEFNQMVGVFKATLQTTYRETVSPHTDKIAFVFWLATLRQDFAELTRRMEEFEKVTFIAKKGK